MANLEHYLALSPAGGGVVLGDAGSVVVVAPLRGRSSPSPAASREASGSGGMAALPPHPPVASPSPGGAASSSSPGAPASTKVSVFARGLRKKKDDGSSSSRSTNNKQEENDEEFYGFARRRPQAARQQADAAAATEATARGRAESASDRDTGGSLSSSSAATTGRNGRSLSSSSAGDPGAAVATAAGATAAAGSGSPAGARGSEGRTWLDRVSALLKPAPVADAAPAARAPASLTLLQRFESGQPTFAMCRTTEAADGYWICRVLEVVSPPDDATVLMKLARLDPVPVPATSASPATPSTGRSFTPSPLTSPSPSSSALADRTLRLFDCTAAAVEEAFLEVATDLLPVELDEVPGPEGVQRYRLVTNVAKLASQVPATGTAASGARFETDPLAMADYMGLYQFDPAAPTGTSTVPINLDSPTEVLSKCDEIVANLSNEVALIDSFPVDGDATAPVQSPWRLQQMVEGIELYRKDSGVPSFHCYLARAVIKASPSEIRHLLENTKNRAYFDPMCYNAEIVQTVDEATSVVYFMNRKFMVTRDFCVLRHSRTTREGHVYYATNSVRTTRCPSRGYLRGVVLNSGFVMFSRGKGECLVSYMTQVNMDGWLPVALTESALEQQVLRVIRRLREHFLARERSAIALSPNRGFSIQEDGAA